MCFALLPLAVLPRVIQSLRWQMCANERWLAAHHIGGTGRAFARIQPDIHPHDGVARRGVTCQNGGGDGRATTRHAHSGSHSGGSYQWP